MSDTLKANYEGWDITVRRLRFHSPAKLCNGDGASFTASGRAVLRSPDAQSLWTDDHRWSR